MRDCDQARPRPDGASELDRNFVLRILGADLDHPNHDPVAPFLDVERQQTAFVLGAGGHDLVARVPGRARWQRC